MAGVPMAELVLFAFGTYMVISILFHGNLFEPKYVKDRVVLLTDSTSTMGRKMALNYANMKAKLFLVGIDTETLNNLTIEFIKAGASDVSGLAGDFKQSEYRQRLIPAVEKKYGHLDYLVLNHQLQASDALWNDTTNIRNIINDFLLSSVELASSALPLLKRSRGHLGFISTMPGKISLSHLAAVSAVKAALHAYLASVRQELKQKKDYVSVTSVTLAYVKDFDGSLERGRWGNLFSLYGTVELEDAVNSAINFIGGRKKEVTYPFAAQFHSCIHSWFPSLYENPKMPSLTHLILPSMPTTNI